MGSKVRVIRSSQYRGGAGPLLFRFKEILESGFRKVDTVDLLQDNYFVRFEKAPVPAPASEDKPLAPLPSPVSTPVDSPSTPSQAALRN